MKPLVAALLCLATPAALAGQPEPGMHLRDGGLDVVALADTTQMAVLQLGIEFGHTLRFGGTLQGGAFWPAERGAYKGAGPLFGVGGTAAVQFMEGLALLAQAEIDGCYLGLDAPGDGANFGRFVARLGPRLTLFRAPSGSGIDVFLGASWTQGIGSVPVDLPNGFGASVGFGVGFHNL